MHLENVESNITGIPSRPTCVNLGIFPMTINAFHLKIPQILNNGLNGLRYAL